MQSEVLRDVGRAEGGGERRGRAAGGEEALLGRRVLLRDGGAAWEEEAAAAAAAAAHPGRLPLRQPSLLVSHGRAPPSPPHWALPLPRGSREKQQGKGVLEHVQNACNKLRMFRSMCRKREISEGCFGACAECVPDQAGLEAVRECSSSSPWPLEQQLLVIRWGCPLSKWPSKGVFPDWGLETSDRSSRCHFQDPLLFQL